MPRSSRVGKKCARILEYLEQAELKETDPWRRDDLRVAWKTVLYAAEGRENPWEAAWTSYYGKPLQNALDYWANRDRITAAALERCRLVAEENQRAAENRRLASLPPKKPSQSSFDFEIQKSEEEA